MQHDVHGGGGGEAADAAAAGGLAGRPAGREMVACGCGGGRDSGVSRGGVDGRALGARFCSCGSCCGGRWCVGGGGRGVHAFTQSSVAAAGRSGGPGDGTQQTCLARACVCALFIVVARCSAACQRRFCMTRARTVMLSHALPSTSTPRARIKRSTDTSACQCTGQHTCMPAKHRTHSRDGGDACSTPASWLMMQLHDSCAASSSLSACKRAAGRHQQRCGSARAQLRSLLRRRRTQRQLRGGRRRRRDLVRTHGASAACAPQALQQHGSLRCCIAAGQPPLR